jgi:RNA polymerase sigma-70 factor (ECF subfamily)
MKVHPASESASSPRPYAAWEDAALVQALRRDDKLAFAEIYERHWLKLYHVACYRLPSREVAEEMVQDVFAALWSKRATATIHKLEPYLYSALCYQVIDFVRSNTVRSEYQAYCRLHALKSDNNTEQSLNLMDLSATLAASLGLLPRPAREVFRLSRMEHHTVPEIALQLNVSPKMVEYHLTKALKQLRVALRDFLVNTVALVLLFSQIS